MKLLAIVTLAAATCTPSPTPTPTPAPDAAPAPVVWDASTPAAKACANLAALGCIEGTDPSCAKILDNAPALGLDFNAACLATATSKAGVRACGSGVRCP